MLARKRKWKNDAERKREARAARDTGTPELAMKRMLAVRGGDGKAGDPVLASHPIDVLLARKEITEPENQAAWIYAKLHAGIYGPSHAAAVGWEQVGRGSLVSAYIEDIGAEKARAERFRRADALLKRDDRWARKLLRDVMLDGRELNAYSVGLMRPGLRILAREFGLMSRNS